MDEIQFLENRFGGRWCGIVFDRNCTGEGPKTHEQMPFCKALAKSQSWPIELTREIVNCPGGSYSMGWGDGGKQFSKSFATKAGLEIDIAELIVRQTPRLNGDIERVVVGTRNDPDVFISFAQPETVMKIIHQWQSLYGSQIMIETSGYLSLCSSVAVNAFLSDRICLSFGCPDSRKHTKIGRDRLIIGLSRRLADLFRQEAK